MSHLIWMLITIAAQQGNLIRILEQKKASLANRNVRWGVMWCWRLVLKLLAPDCVYLNVFTPRGPRSTAEVGLISTWVHWPILDQQVPSFHYRYIPREKKTFKKSWDSTQVILLCMQTLKHLDLSQTFLCVQKFTSCFMGDLVFRLKVLLSQGFEPKTLGHNKWPLNEV